MMNWFRKIKGRAFEISRGEIFEIISLLAVVVFVLFLFYLLM